MNALAGPGQRPLAVTMGEPAGIGPDITLAAWRQRLAYGLDPFFVVGAPQVLETRAREIGISAAIEIIERPDAAASVFASALPVIVIPCPPARPGVPSTETARAVIAAIESAVQYTLSGEAAAVVTNPIAKSVLAAAGFGYPGHTEFLAALSAGGGRPSRPVMMLAGPTLRVVPVTIHVALRDVPAMLSADLIVETAEITTDGLVRYFGIARPRLAVAGLNPHAGEDGLFGDEERRIITPALERLKERGLDVVGPLSADTMFHAEARRGYDAALCMYHDQALIPIKTIAFDDAVNVTLGLEFLRTSPDHGTAFDIAGTGRAREASLIAALRMAQDCARRAREGAVVG